MESTGHAIDINLEDTKKYLKKFKKIGNFNFEEMDFDENQESIERATKAIQILKDQTIKSWYRVKEVLTEDADYAAFIYLNYLSQDFESIPLADGSSLVKELISRSKNFVFTLLKEGCTKEELYKECLEIRKITSNKGEHISKTVNNKILIKSIDSIDVEKAKNFISSSLIATLSVEKLINLYLSENKIIVNDRVIAALHYLKKENLDIPKELSKIHNDISS